MGGQIQNSPNTHIFIAIIFFFFFLLTAPTATVPNGTAPWEDALAQGMEATKIAGKSLDALQGFSSSVDLVAVSKR